MPFFNYFFYSVHSSASSSTNIESKYDHIADSAFKQRFLQNIASNQSGLSQSSKVVRTALERNPEMDERLRNEWEKQQSGEDYIDMLFSRARLPSNSKKAEILQALQENQVLVISGDTGQNGVK